jgi:uncharacterized lipoprotein YajG
MKKKTILGASAALLLLSACQAGRSTAPQTASADSWCQENPMSAVCPEGKAAIERKSQWCQQYPQSAVCS